MIQKSILITELHEKWLKKESKRLGLSESDIMRRLIDGKNMESGIERINYPPPEGEGLKE